MVSLQFASLERMVSFVLGGTVASKGGSFGSLQMLPQTQRSVKPLSELTPYSLLLNLPSLPGMGFGM